jgi:tetratricopeptide (TPR) repeat protein
LQIGLSPPDRSPPLRLSHENVRTGANVYAIGSPRGLVNTLSTGIISGVRQGPIGKKMLQTTASISPGSSGGPLLNDRGEVVGVTTLSQIDGQQLNFAVTATEIDRLLKLPPINRDLWRGKSVTSERRAAFIELVVYVNQLSDQAEAANADAIQALRRLQKSFAAFEARKFEDAEGFGRDAMEDLPEDYEYLANYLVGHAIFAAAQTRHNQKAPDVRTLEALKQFDKELARGCEQAIPWLLASLNTRSDFSPTLQSLFLTCDLSGRKTDALIHAQDLVRVVPKCAMAYEFRGRARANLREYDSAVSDFKLALELDPNCTSALLSLHAEYLRAAAIEGISPVDRRRLTEQADEFKKRALEIIRRRDRHEAE